MIIWELKTFKLYETNIKITELNAILKIYERQNIYNERSP